MLNILYSLEHLKLYLRAPNLLWRQRQ